MDIGYAPGKYLVLATIETKSWDGSIENTTLFEIATIFAGGSPASPDDIVDMLLFDTGKQVDEAKFAYIARVDDTQRSGVYSVDIKYLDRSTGEERPFRCYTALGAEHTIYDALVNLMGVIGPGLGIVSFSYAPEITI